MRIAFATDDNKNISHHFGSSIGFMIFEIINGKILNEEFRKNIGKNTGKCGSCNHDKMIENIKDCDVVITYGMGRNIYSDLLKNNIQAVITNENIPEISIFEKALKDPRIPERLKRKADSTGIIFLPEEK